MTKQEQDWLLSHKKRILILPILIWSIMIAFVVIAIISNWGSPERECKHAAYKGQIYDCREVGK